jgi:hypothetical protein
MTKEHPRQRLQHQIRACCRTSTVIGGIAVEYIRTMAAGWFAPAGLKKRKPRQANEPSRNIAGVLGLPSVEFVVGLGVTPWPN